MSPLPVKMMRNRIKRFIYLAGNQGGSFMRYLFLTLLLCACVFGASSIYDFTLDSINGQAAPLSAYQGKVLLLVNVASKCGFTPQYEQLQAIYERYKDKGLVVIGFPANNFMAQEPGTNEEIKDFCSRKYNVTFPMYSKISVKGDDKAPLYQFLTDKSANPSTGGEIKWNFTKFLVGRDGKIAARFEPAVKPDAPQVVAAIEKALQ
jgi:glutathione peroxidase